MPEFTNDLTHDDLALLLLLAEKRSLTRSAMTLAWSTPKASHRLNHARALIGDELFVRSGNSLVPTKRMEALVPTMRRALEALEGIFAEERFSPLEIDRTIIFEMVDNAAAVLLAHERRDVQPQAEMLCRGHLAEEGRATAFERGVRKARPVVFHHENQRAVTHVEASVHLGRRIAHGVVQQVLGHLAHDGLIHA